jgi:hypothetical protein
MEVHTDVGIMQSLRYTWSDKPMHITAKRHSGIAVQEG